MKKSKKTTLQIMYETVIEEGGPKGPLSKAVVDAFENTDQFKINKRKIILSFKKNFNQ